MKSRTWTPTPDMTERQIEKELNRQMVLFDEECRGSSLTDGHIKFETFAGQWQKEYVEKALGKRTQANYKQMLPRIYAAIGHLYMDKITPRHIQKFINNLGETGVNQTRKDWGLSPRSIKKPPVRDLRCVRLCDQDGDAPVQSLPGRHAAAFGDRQGEAVLYFGGGAGISGCPCRRPAAVAGVLLSGPVRRLSAGGAVRL